MTLLTWPPSSAAPQVVESDISAQAHRAPQKAKLVGESC